MPATCARIRRAEFLASHRESTALGVGQVKWTWATLLPEDPILIPKIIDHVFLVAVHPASGREHEEAQSVGHSLRLLGEQPLAPTWFRRFANLGRFVAPYDVDITPHVKWNNKTQYLRVHFFVEHDEKAETRRIIIGHCGDHLDTYGTKRRR